MEFRIYYEDTDAGGVVYHSNYLKFCERARSEMFFVKNARIFDAQNGHFLLTKANCSFLNPAKLGDIIKVKTQILELKNASVLIKQEIFRLSSLDKLNGESANLPKLFEAVFTLAFVKNEKPAKMSNEIKELFLSLF